MLDINVLRQVPLFKSLTNEQLQWLSQQGKDLWLQPNEILRVEGDSAEHVFILLEGKFQITQKLGNQEVVLKVHENEKTIFGELPVLTGLTHFWASGVASSHCHIFELPNEAFWQMIMTMPSTTKTILRTMTQRMQETQVLLQQREKLAALGTLSAGLAHELNNPASASYRASQRLRENLQLVCPMALKLYQETTNMQRVFLAKLQAEALASVNISEQLDSLTQSELEEEVVDWLEMHDIEEGWKLAPTLVQAGLDIDQLEAIKQKFSLKTLNDVFTWLETTLTGAQLLREIEQSTERIAQLVQAIKDYSYMDRGPCQLVDLHKGLESTLTILNHRLKQGVVLTREYDRSLPRINAYGSELNQVWTNLIDNAIDAMSSSGRIWIRTSREKNCILVEIADNGPGIPPEIQSRIFDPFFTTKGVGEGSGLGLYIAYRIVVEHHQGNISVISEPGNTRFQIRLPIEQAK
ncbi:ATP-binding protein [Scytonema sp. NUACC21]